MHPYLASLIGGVMIGTAATIMWNGLGRVAGISGILGSLLRPVERRQSWRWMFVAGMVAGGVFLAVAAPAAVGVPPVTSTSWLVIAGLLVGYGTQLGSGCTSGHGVCGISRGSARSIVATCVSISAGMLTVALVRAIGGA